MRRHGGTVAAAVVVCLGIAGAGRAAIVNVETRGEVECEAAAFDGEDNPPQRDFAQAPEETNFTTYDHQLSASVTTKFATAQATANHRSTVTATTDSLVISSSSSTSITATRGGDLLNSRTGGGGVAAFSASFCITERATYTLSGFVRVDTTGNTASSETEFEFDGPEQILYADTEDSDGTPRNVTLSKSGTLEIPEGDDDACFYVYLFTISTVGNTQTQSATSWNLELQVTSNPAPPSEGDRIKWVGGPSGAFGDPENWDPPRVPILTDTRSDTALVLGGNPVAMDLVGGDDLGSGQGGTLSRTAGRLIVRVNPLRLLDGELVLDALSPDEPSLVVTNLGAVELDTGRIRARHATIGESVKGSVIVRAPVGAFETLGRCAIGAGGEGVVRVESGGFVSTAETLLGNGTRPGFGFVVGPDATWLTGNMAVGYQSDGNLSIAEGGLVTSDIVVVDQRLANDEEAVALVQSTPAANPSEWTMNQLQVRGRGRVEIAAGGLVRGTDVRVGPGGFLVESTGTGRIDVHGGRLEVADQLAVGDNGPGTLDVDPAGRVVVDGALRIGDGAGNGIVTLTGPSAENQIVSESLLMPTNATSRGQLVVGEGCQMLTQGLVEIGTAGGSGLARVDGNSTAPLETRWRTAFSLAIGQDSPAPAGEFVVPTGVLELADGVFEATGTTGGGAVDVRRTGEIRGGGLFQVLRASGGVNNNGVITGPLRIEGDYVTQPQGTLAVNVATAGFGAPLGSAAAGPAGGAPVEPVPPGPIEIDGTAVLDGRLVLQFYAGYAPSQGESFPLLTVTGSTSGAFAGIDVRGLVPGAEFESSVQGGNVTVTALNDTVALPTVSLASKPKVSEKKKAGAKVKVTRTGDTAAPMLVRYALGGSATSGSDYAQLPGTIEIPAGKKTAKLVVKPLADGYIEDVETIEVRVVPGDDYTPSLDSAVTIQLVSKDKAKKRKQSD